MHWNRLPCDFIFKIRECKCANRSHNLSIRCARHLLCMQMLFFRGSIAFKVCYSDWVDAQSACGVGFWGLHALKFGQKEDAVLICLLVSKHWAALYSWGCCKSLPWSDAHLHPGLQADCLRLHFKHVLKMNGAIHAGSLILCVMLYWRLDCKGSQTRWS